MDFKKKWQHFWRTCLSYFPSILMVIALSRVVFLFSEKSESDVFATSFFSGIIASMIASLALRITDKYLASYQAFDNILVQATAFCEYIKSSIILSNGNFHTESRLEKYRFNIYYLEQGIKAESEKLTYKNDYNVLANSLFNVVNAVYTNCNVDELKELVEDLEDRIESITG